jgi:hypothetical protein
MTTEHQQKYEMKLILKLNKNEKLRTKELK